MSVRQPVHTLRTRCCTWRKIGPLVIVDEGGRHTMEASDKSSIEGIIVMQTTVPDPPKVGGVKAVPETGKESPQWNVGIVARKATGRTSAGKKGPIRINPDRAKLNIGINNGCTTFVMKHNANSMKASTSKTNEV